MFVKGKEPVPKRPLVTKATRGPSRVPRREVPMTLDIPKHASEFDNNTERCFECISHVSDAVSVNGLLRHVTKCLDRIIGVARRDFNDKNNTTDGRSHIQKNCLGPIAKIISKRPDIQMLVTNGNDATGASGMKLPDQIRQDFVKILVAEFRRRNKHVVTGSKAFQKTYNKVSRSTQLHLKLEPDSFGRDVYPDGSYLTLSDSVEFDPSVLGIAIGSSGYPGKSVYFKSKHDHSIGRNRVNPSEYEPRVVPTRKTGRHNVFKYGSEYRPAEKRDLNTLYTTGDRRYQQANLNHFYNTQDELVGRRVTRRY